MNDDAAPVAATVRDYYEALRRGEPLDPYFHEHEATAKVGVSEHLVGHEVVAEGLREQTRRTSNWVVESEALSVGRRGDTGWFSDHVRMAWTRRGDRVTFETRWSGALVRRVGEGIEDEWPFVELHVSAPQDLSVGVVDAAVAEDERPEPVVDPDAETDEDEGKDDPGER